jgi:hypothetical protein
LLIKEQFFASSPKQALYTQPTFGQAELSPDAETFCNLAKKNKFASLKNKVKKIIYNN